MDETHRILLETQQLSTYALFFIALMALAATFIAGWVVWLTRDLRREMDRNFEQSVRRTEQLGHYLFGKLGSLDTK